MKKKSDDPFKSLGNIAIGTAKLGIVTGVGATLSGRLASQYPGAPNLGGSFTTVARFAPIAVTGLAGKTVLDTITKRKKR